MIFDRIERIKTYLGMHAKLDIAIRDLLERDFNREFSCPFRLSDGVYFSTAEVSLRSREESRWECHDAYIDLQYVFGGAAETIEYANRDALSGWRKEPEGDIYFSDDGALFLPLKLEPGYFAVFFPQDAHRPAQGNKGESSRKAVYKVPVK